MLSLASKYVVKFYNFYPHLSLKTVFPVLKLSKICDIYICEHFFLKTGNLITNWLSYTHKWNSKISVLQLFSKLGEIWKYSLSYHSKIPLFYHFYKLEKFWSLTTAKLNPSFQCFCELGKRLKYSLGPKHNDSSFESKNIFEKLCANLSFTIEN